MKTTRPGALSRGVTRYTTTAISKVKDSVAVEAPLEIRMKQPNARVQTVAVTMRTPGDDVALAVGFLFAEGIIHSLSDVIRAGPDPRLTDAVNISLGRHPRTACKRLNRLFNIFSSCGVCGKKSKQALDLPNRRRFAPVEVTMRADVIRELPDRLLASQTVFRSTGGLHGAALLQETGELMIVMEDVGRHNAVDKVVGWQVMEGYAHPRAAALAVSGRVSFEVIQKAYMAGISVIVAVGAPTTLAVDLARKYGLTLVGFAKCTQFNVYAGRNRIL